MRVISFGGGVQSTAQLVLASQGRIDYQTFLFANVGNDSEAKATLRYMAEHAGPFADEHGLRLIEIRRVHKRGPEKGQPFQTLRSYVEDRSIRSIPIPVRVANGSPGNRQCTERWKIVPVADWCREHGATDADPALVGLGISTDEIQRAKPGVDKQHPHTVKTYPLLDLGLSRKDCRDIITDAGLPMPPKSACSFCPYSSPEAWRRLKRDDPDQFETEVEFERSINALRAKMGRDDVFLHIGLAPLDRAVDDQLVLDLEGDGDDCDSGYCFT